MQPAPWPAPHGSRPIPQAKPPAWVMSLSMTSELRLTPSARLRWQQVRIRGQQVYANGSGNVVSYLTPFECLSLKTKNDEATSAGTSSPTNPPTISGDPDRPSEVQSGWSLLDIMLSTEEVVMPDILICGLSSRAAARIDAEAAAQGLSRNECLRRQLEQGVSTSSDSKAATVKDLVRASRAAADLVNSEVMDRAWSWRPIAGC